MRKWRYFVVVGVALTVVLFILHSYAEDTATANASPAHHSRSNRFGYVLASSYFDQITGSMANFISMQCWTATLSSDVRVVEPFILHSTFGLNTSILSKRQMTKDDVKLGDLFNKSEWIRTTNGSGYAPVIDWEFFVKDAPLKLILVDRKCIRREESYRKCDDCINLIDSLKFNHTATGFARNYGFEVVRTTCIPEILVNAGQFRKLVYGSYNPSEVVVMFESWGRVQQNELDIRAGISDIPQCNRLNFYYYIPVSNRIMEDGARYMRKYMPGALTKGYIAVMLRMQYISITNGFSARADGEVKDTLNRCFNRIRKSVHALQAEHQIELVFLTLDCRKQGSYYFKQSRLANILSQSVSDLYKMLIGTSSTLSDWDDSFDDVASFENPGYIAILQKHLAAKSTCLLTAGGPGAFQSTTKTMYNTYHQPEGNQSSSHCVFDFNSCRPI